MNMKKFLALVLAALTLLSLAAPAFAASSTLSGGSSSGLGGSSSSSSETQQGVITNCSNWVSLRKAASSSAERIAKLEKNTVVSILGSEGNYYKVSVSGKTGYVSAQYVAAYTGSGSSTGSTGSSGLGGSSSSSAGLSGGSSSSSSSKTQQGVIANCESWVSMRKTASSSSSRIAKLDKGTVVTVLGVEGGYVKVSVGEKTGYVSAQYVASYSSGSSSSSTGSSGLGGSSSSSGGLSGGVNSSSPGYSSGSSGLGGGSSSSSSSTGSSTTGTTTGSVNFRQGPGTKYDKVSGCTKVPKGSTVTILGSEDGWYKVSYAGYTGYLSDDYVTVNTASSGSTSSPSNGLSGGTSSGSSMSGSSSQGGGGAKYAKYTGTTSDRWGTISVAGTNINTYIYCNAINSKGQFYYNAYSGSSSYIYALSYLGSSLASITGHNMRVSQTGFHGLHHVQNAWLGKSKCDYTKRCSASTSGAKTSVFNINYDGYTRWQLVCFYEIDKSTVSSSSKRYNILMTNCFTVDPTPAQRQTWLEYQKQYANSSYRGMWVSNASANDKLMILSTCADNSGDDYQRLYMVLKAIG